MAKYFIKKQTLEEVANIVKGKTGITDKTNIEGMQNAIEGLEISDKIMEIVNGTISSYSNNDATKVRQQVFGGNKNLIEVNLNACIAIDESAFFGCSNLISVNFPNCITIGSHAFSNCTNLENINFPQCNTIGYLTFAGCKSISNISFPNCKTVGSYAFNYCSNISLANIPVCTTIYDGAFQYCTNFSNLTLGGTSICNLKNSNVFNGTPISSGTGYIYVPSSLVASYKAATNWTYFSNQIVGI